MTNLKGKVITFEGGEGAGKSTIIQLVEEYLNSQGLDVMKTREPGGSKIAEQIREVIVSKDNKGMCYETEALLYAAARAQLLDELRKQDLSSKVVIFDRFIDSSYVYQGITRGLGIDMIESINQYGVKDFVPYKTFILDIDPKIGLERIASNNRETNRLDEESLDFHYKVRNGYLEIAKKYPNRCVVIDANQTPEQILQDIIPYL